MLVLSTLLASLALAAALQSSPLVLDRHDVGKADSSDCAELKNHGSHFTVELVAEPAGQKFEVVVDTGSDELVLPSCECNQVGACSGRCLEEPIPKSAHKVGLFYGSGGVKAAVMSGTVRVGAVTADMDESMLVMYDNDLDLAGQFEGILALGPPHRGGARRMLRLPDSARDTTKRQSDRITGSLDTLKTLGDAAGIHTKHSGDVEDAGGDDRYFYTKGFLEEAKVKHFSLCFNRGSYGVLRFAEDPPEVEGSLGSIGGVHWGLGLSGISTGAETGRMVTCDTGSADAGTQNPCGAIPDSGTSFIMAPAKQLDELYEGLCQEWPKCSGKANTSELPMARVFAGQVESCDDLESLPSIFFHLTGTNSSKTLEIPGTAYVYQSSFDCHLAFDVLEYHTDQNGPVWILGLPVFFTYRVGYDVSAEPPSMTFEDVACTSCTDSFFRGRVGYKPDLKWEINGPPRKPALDPSLPL